MWRYPAALATGKPFKEAQYETAAAFQKLAELKPNLHSIWTKTPLAVSAMQQLALRPEKVDMAAVPMTAEANTCTGKIKHIVYLGTVTHYYVTSEHGDAFVVYWQNQAASYTSGPLRVADAIHLSWKPEHTLILENDDECSDVVAAKERA
jgi:ABC-type Fe3+/spermidine/putrescine transport system ATPase subunit